MFVFVTDFSSHRSQHALRMPRSSQHYSMHFWVVLHEKSLTGIYGLHFPTTTVNLHMLMFVTCTQIHLAFMWCCHLCCNFTIFTMVMTSFPAELQLNTILLIQMFLRLTCIYCSPDAFSLLFTQILGMLFLCSNLKAHEHI